MIMKLSKQILISLVSCFLLLLAASEINAQEKDVSVLVEEAKKAGINQAKIATLQKRAQSRGVSDQYIGQILETALAMSEKKLPAEMALEKALEGLSKGIPGGRIVPAISQMQENMTKSAQVVDPWIKQKHVQQIVNKSGSGMSQDQFRTEMVRSVSSSFAQGISTETVNAMLSQIESKSILDKTNSTNIVVAMGIFSDLPTTKSAPKASRTFIANALKRGFNADELQKLPSALQMGQQRSQLPAASVVNRVSQQMKGGIPAKKILENLFNGNIGGGPPGNVPKGLENKPENKGKNNSGGNGNGTG
ncbi:hypothetical protein LX73_0568 [Fodinibius salinus]|uniref:Uncharacterized protein n=2 Tax=Fodinibius salinus TaxID=860790 RepID=A0A5D3YMY8_9BACT|nr:hypothetical protein LX73_0568 [Fodinibius salinus]